MSEKSKKKLLEKIGFSTQKSDISGGRKLAFQHKKLAFQHKKTCKARCGWENNSLFYGWNITFLCTVNLVNPNASKKIIHFFYGWNITFLCTVNLVNPNASEKIIHFFYGWNITFSTN